MKTRLIRNLVGVAIVTLSCLAYADAKLDGKFLTIITQNDQTFGYYNIQKIIVRASCLGFPYAHHHELYADGGDIANKSRTAVPTKHCRDANRSVGAYELKFITPSGEYKCGSISTRGDAHGLINVLTLEKRNGTGLDHCTWTYNGRGRDHGGYDE